MAVRSPLHDGVDPTFGRPLAARLGIEDIDPELLVRALTHRSYAYENGGLPTNERLEFLGDSVLGLIVTDTLYSNHPDLPEGQLAKLRAAVVNMRALASVARGVGIGDFVRLGRGEETTGGRDKASILADTLEALIGAAYLGVGLDAATGLVHRLFDPIITASAGLGAGLDWKTSLQELTATAELGVPEYEVTETGPDHQKTFAAQVRVAGTVRGAGSGRSKKEAEQQAAEHAWRSIRDRIALNGTSDPAAPAERSTASVGPLVTTALSAPPPADQATAKDAVGPAADGPAADGVVRFAEDSGEPSG